MSSKLREELLKADVLISIATFDEDVNMDEVEKIRSEIKAAIAEPLRNCDIGSAEEQAIRFEAYCDSHTNCAHCPLAGQQCVLAWSQMPYEEEVK